MKSILFAVVLLTSVLAQADLHPWPTCKAEYRDMLVTGTVETLDASMYVTLNDQSYLRFEADIKKLGYIVRFEKGTDKVFVTISVAPGYTVGTNANTTFNQDGTFTLAYVNNNLVGKITCKK